MNKQAQGLPLSTIVIAASVLIVLIVLVGIFTGFFSQFVPDLKAVTEQTCELPNEAFPNDCPKGYNRMYGNYGDNLKKGEVCCKPEDSDKEKQPIIDERGLCRSPFFCSTNCLDLGFRLQDSFKCPDEAENCCG